MGFIIFFIVSMFYNYFFFHVYRFDGFFRFVKGFLDLMVFLALFYYGKFVLMLDLENYYNCFFGWIYILKVCFNEKKLKIL
jgi:hypothetical protein